MNNNVNMFGCIQVITTGACQNQAYINCSGMSGNPGMNNRTYNLNGRVLKNGWIEINSTTASALAPKSINGDLGNKIKMDASAGDCYVKVDIKALDGETITVKVIDGTNNLIVSTENNTEYYFDTANQTLPYTINPATGDVIRISSDGTKLIQI